MRANQEVVPSRSRRWAARLNEDVGPMVWGPFAVFVASTAPFAIAAVPLSMTGGWSEGWRPAAGLAVGLLVAAIMWRRCAKDVPASTESNQFLISLLALAFGVIPSEVAAWATPAGVVLGLLVGSWQLKTMGPSGGPDKGGLAVAADGLAPAESLRQR